MSTLVALWNKSNTGKSSTILELANLTKNTFPDFNLIFCNKDHLNLTIDFRLIIQINNTIIAFESQGDPRTELENRLTEIINTYQPDIIFCTTRTKGETVQSVERIAANFDFDVIWTSTYQVSNNFNFVNSVKAEHLLNLVQRLNLL